MRAYPLFRSLLFRLEPEQAHRLTLQLIHLAGQLPPVGSLLKRYFSAPGKPISAFGLTFPNPVGLAAGYDKDGTAWRGLACLGFGHIEIGTVTPLPQPGNPKPRLFRLPEAQALINRLGFPGGGMQPVARALNGPRPPGLVLGVNLGKNKDTPLEGAIADYLLLARTFAPLADYLAINVSSPNTARLRSLQARPVLESLLGELAAWRRQYSDQNGKNVPILVKLAPDLSEPELEDALGAILSSGMDGVIATNTTVSRSALAAFPGIPAGLASQAGGLSGLPLREQSTALVARIAKWTGGRLPIVAVGGIMSPRDAQQKLEAGASLVQLYTGLVYAGPGLVHEILTSLDRN